MSPGEAPPVQGILEALHAGLVAVVDGGGAGEGVQQHHRQRQPPHRPPPRFGGQVIGGPGLLGLGNGVRPQQRQDAGRVVGAQNVQPAVEGGRGIVLPLLLHGVPERCRVAAADIVQHRAAQGIVHQAVGLPAQQIPPPAGIGDLVAAVLPHLAQQIAVGLFLLHDGADLLDEVVRQLVGHVQPPAVGAAPQPPADHAVLIPDDKVPVGGGVLVDGGQGVDVPPRVVLLRPPPEAEPVVPGGVLALIGPRRVEKAVAVEVAAVVAGVVEHAVQDHMHAPLLRLGAQVTEILLRAQQGVHHPVIRRVVAVAAGGVEDGIQVQRGDGQALKIVQLLPDALQAAAEEIAVPPAGSGVRAQPGQVVPVVMYGALSQQSPGIGTGQTAEAIWKNLVCHAPAEPVRRGPVLIDGQLPGLPVGLAAPAVAAQKGAAAVPAGEAEGVPHQLRCVGCGEHAGKAAGAGQQGRFAPAAGKLAEGHRRAGGKRLLRRDGEGHRRAAGHRAEGGFVSGVAGIKNSHRQFDFSLSMGSMTAGSRGAKRRLPGRGVTSAECFPPSHRRRTPDRRNRR